MFPFLDGTLLCALFVTIGGSLVREKMIETMRRQLEPAGTDFYSDQVISVAFQNEIAPYQSISQANHNKDLISEVS